MGESILGLVVLLIAILGIYRVKQAFDAQERPALCIALEGQEAFIENTIRDIMLRVRLLPVVERLLILFEDPDGDTLAIAERMAAKMSFDFGIIRGKKIYLCTPAAHIQTKIRMIDMRGKKNFAEIYRTINII